MIRDTIPPRCPSNEINPDHYQGTACIEFIERFELDFHLGNAIKYIARCGNKLNTEPSTDIRKAIWYLERELGLIDGEI